MKKILITVGQGEFSDKKIKQLEAVVVRNFKQYVSTEKVFVLWNFVPKGNGFNDYEERQTSLLMAECDDNFPQNKRVAMFEACTRDWLPITKQSIDHLVVVVAEKEMFDNFLQRNSRHLTTFGKLQMYANMLLSIGHSRLTKGYNAFASSI